VKIYMTLSQDSIETAISDLELFKEFLDYRLCKVAEDLTNKGAEEAQNAYGDFGVIATPMSAENEGNIVVYGDQPLIAEFGAGDATVDPSDYFEHVPETDVFPGSYSRENARQYWDWGSWVFGGQRYTEVPPHLGLYKAKEWIKEHSTEIAQGEFGND